MIDVQTILLKETPFANKLIKSYLGESPELKPFISDFPSVESLKNFATNRSIDPSTRAMLVQALRSQYGAQVQDAEEQSLQRLSEENCFTVTTGHQLNILSGPLYTLFKIASIISLAKELGNAGTATVPVFWLASEDHDLEEIDHTNVDGQALQWQREQEGAVGQMSTEGMEDVLAQLEEKIGRFPHSAELLEVLRKAYSVATLGKASSTLYRSLFGRFGLLVLDADDADLKREFIPLAKKELEQNDTEQKVIEQTEALAQLDYHAQVHPRAINLFYLENNLRTRIVREADRFTCTEGDKQWTLEEIRAELEEHPERFSPNALLRPMYQEMILPNLAYIGGGGELSYWLQLKTAFESHAIPFPILIHRDSAMLLDGGARKRWEKNEVDAQQFFQRKDVYLKKVVTENASFDMQEHFEKLENLYEGILQDALKIDAGLENMVKGELERQKKSLGNLEGRMLKAEKNNQVTRLSQLDKLHDTLLPNEKLQERVENFSGFYARHGSTFLDALVEVANPLEGAFRIIKL